MALGDILGGLGMGLGSAAQGYLGGQVRGEAEGFRRRQLGLAREDRQAQLAAQKEYRAALAQLAQQKLDAQTETAAAKAAADATKPFRTSVGRIAEKMAARRGDPELQGWFAQNPGMAAVYDAAVRRGLSIAGGLVDPDPEDLTFFSEMETNIPGSAGAGGMQGPATGLGAAPVADGAAAGFDTSDVMPGQYQLFESEHGGTIIPTPPTGGTGIAAPRDFPAADAGTRTLNGRSFIPTAPGEAPTPTYETPKQMAERHKREAQAARDAAKKPLTAAQAQAAAARARKTDLEADEVTRNASSTRLYRDRSGRAAIGRAAASGTSAGAAATRAATDKKRLEEQKRANRAKETDQARRTTIAELNGAQNRVMSAARVDEIRKKAAKAGAQMSDIDRRKWQYYSKNAVRTKKGKGGVHVTVDPKAVAELEALQEKYKSPGRAGLGTMVKPPPPGVDREDWLTITDLVDKGQFDAFLSRLPATHERRVQAKKLFKMYTGTDYRPTSER